MSVALLIITHTPFGSAALDAVCTTLGELPIPTAVMDITPDCDPEQERRQALELLQQLDQGDGVLILTDLFGATPSNIACGLMDTGYRLRLVSGLNLAMLIRVMNYAHENLSDLADKAYEGGRCGIQLHPPLALQESMAHD